MAAWKTQMEAGARLSLTFFPILFSLLLSCHDIYGSTLSRRISQTRYDFRSEAIERLSKVFGIEKLPQHSYHRSPPEYMLRLYNSVAYSDGITKTANPYDADIVRGFPDRASTQQMHFLFNVSYISSTEGVLEAEFHLFRLRSRASHIVDHSTRLHHVVELYLYQVMDPDRLYSASGLKLIEHRRISSHRHGWQIFKVRDTVGQWVNDSSTNHGFLVTVSARSGEYVNGTYMRFAQRSNHHDSKQPVLVVFTEEERMRMLAQLPSTHKTNTGSPPNTEKKQKQGPDIKNIRRNYVQFLNEEYRAQRGDAREVGRNYMSPSMHKRLISETSRTKRSVDYYRYSRRRRKRACARHELYVDFEEIGWSGWIISPKGYNAYHCKGECPFPLGQNQKPTNHATVQSIVHALRIGKDVGTPCCVPNKLYSISLLYFDDDENVILKQYDDMVAAGCGCH